MDLNKEEIEKLLVLLDRVKYENKAEWEQSKQLKMKLMMQLKSLMNNG